MTSWRRAHSADSRPLSPLKPRSGGDIDDLAGQLWNLSTRGRDFLERAAQLRDR
jgi:hypothetical protein